VRSFRVVLGVVAVLAIGLSGGAISSAEAVTPSKDLLVAKPAEVDFKSKRVGTENYKRTKINVWKDGPVRLVVTAGLPDDFGFGLLPGETCPVFDTGEILAAGAACEVVVRFSPTAGFVGLPAVGSLTATARNPDTGEMIAELTIPVLGEAVL